LALACAEMIESVSEWLEEGGETLLPVTCAAFEAADFDEPFVSAF
jgi:hypothetical protein